MTKTKAGGKTTAQGLKSKKVRPKDRLFISQPYNNEGSQDVEVDMDVDVDGAFDPNLDIKGMTRTRQSLKKEHRLSRPKEKRKVEKFEFEENGFHPQEDTKSGLDDEDGEKISDLDEDDFAMLGSDFGSEDDLSVHLSDLEDIKDGKLEEDDVDDEKIESGSESGLSHDTIDSDDVDGMKLDSDYEEQGEMLKLYLEALTNQSREIEIEGELDENKDIEEQTESGEEVDEEADDAEISAIEEGRKSKKQKKFKLDESAAIESLHQRKGGSKAYRTQMEDEDVDETKNSERKSLPVKRNGRFVFENEVSPVSKKRKILLENNSESGNDVTPLEPLPQTRPDELGTRWGRKGIKDILQIQDKTKRLEVAKEEIATLGREIVGDPENSLNYLKRLSALTARTYVDHASDKGEKHVTVDTSIRALAILSLLAVLLDIIPSYRIRPLTEGEKSTKVSQIVQRQRDWEEGLLKIYKGFILICEKEIKDKSKLEGACLKCLCELMKEKTYFNFSQEIMEVVTKRISSRAWDKSSDLCLASIISVFESTLDQSFSSSLNLVRLLSKSIRARSFSVNPKLLSCMLSLQLHDVIKDDTELALKNGDKTKKKEVLSKKARKAKKEQEKIQKEIEEAELTVSKEEKDRNMMETLKTVFTLYFRIIKLPNRTPLLPGALEGLARFGHLVNVDFFKDLMKVLGNLIQGRGSLLDQEEEQNNTDIVQLTIKEKLLCIVTAFQILSGQGEALNIDLSEFSSCLYGLLPSLALSITIEEKVDGTGPDGSQSQYTESQLLSRALHTIFIRSRLPPSPTRTLAFAKRLLLCALHWPPALTIEMLDFLKKIMFKEPKLEGMLDTSDRKGGRAWKGDAEVEWESGAESTVWWELSLLEHTHYDPRVRRHASELARWNESK